MQHNTFSTSARLRALATAVAFAGAAAVSFSAHAADAAAGADRDASPVTHASLMHELQELRAVGYDLLDDNFPESLQRAQRKVEAKHRAAEQAKAAQPASAG
ncbi:MULTISPECIES: DUF4148 domain-containing protein [Cupriavidus]|uniref:DUF4148 domain-containing protein n=1 Tax=Cupriavidus pauculus TaxID=82633 RepID=A0A5P2GYG6_9BURK|nr:DUF4148 domain-containing protein [Cupriavidus pauculus]QET00586.1 DUF4148 domain-containing protein [Cupriavidus pauculus]